MKKNFLWKIYQNSFVDKVNFTFYIRSNSTNDDDDDERAKLQDYFKSRHIWIYICCCESSSFSITFSHPIHEKESFNP